MARAHVAAKEAGLRLLIDARLNARDGICPPAPVRPQYEGLKLVPFPPTA